MSTVRALGAQWNIRLVFGDTDQCTDGACGVKHHAVFAMNSAIAFVATFAVIVSL
jgi:hypothetical protein